MNVPDSDKENAILAEFLSDKPKRGRIFDALTISTLFYIAVVFIDFVVDIERLSLKQFDWQIAIALLALPVLGAIFHLAGKRIGWIINSFAS